MANKKRLIDANALKIAFKCREMADIDMYGGVHIAECFQGYEANEIVDKMPTVDAVEAVYAKWEPVKGFLGFYTWEVQCSRCHTPQDQKSKYCPECGALMDGKNNVPRTDGDGNG